MIVSSIDLGTNTCLMLIGEWGGSAGKEFIEHADFSTVVRLGQDVDKNKALHSDAIYRTLECLKRYSIELKRLGGDPAQTHAVATAQARDSQNFQEFIEIVQKETGFCFKVLSGEQEASYGFLGALLPGQNPENTIVVDIGGGSTEFSHQKDGISLSLGSVKFTERYLKSNPVSDQEFWACEKAIDAELEKAQIWFKNKKNNLILCGVAGTVTSIAATFLGLPEFEKQKIDGLVLTRGDIHRFVEELKWRTIQERKQMMGLDEKRADVILAGALILWRSMEKFLFKEITVSTRGLRYGLLLSF